MSTFYGVYGEQADMSNKNSDKLYDRIRILGRGSFGVVSVNRSRHDCSLVVLKEIDLSRFKGERERLSAINEATIMSTLNHPNIIKYYNTYTTETKLIIEMEYASIGTLGNYLSLQAPLDEREILVIFKQLTTGLSYLHSMNIIHLDLKMENIFLTREGFVKIGDFGIARHLDPSESEPSDFEELQSRKSHSSSSARGAKKNEQRSPLHCTLAFSSPEQCLGKPTDFKSDIWSLGCILYELITGKQLFSAESLPQLVLSITKISYQPIKRSISPSLRQTFERMIARDPNDRPTAHELYRITSHLLSLLNQNQRRLNAKLPRNQGHHSPVISAGHHTHYKRHLNEVSSEMAWRAELNDDEMDQLYYHHSLVYQVRLDTQNIQLDRVNLPQSKRIKEISKGKSHYLVLTYDNIVLGWGSKSHGQLGSCEINKLSPLRGRRKSQPNVTTVDLNRNIDAVSNSKIIRPHDNRESQPISKPLIINELNHRKIIQVAAGDNFSVFLSKTGIVMTCGDGSKGCLGYGSLLNSFKPCMVESLLNHDVTYVACGYRHVVAVCGNGRAYAWGKNSHGRLGIGSSNKSNRFVSKPQLVVFPNDVLIKSVHCGDKCSVFIDSNKRTWACGQNRSNKLGLDIMRRFKGRKVIEQTLVPVEIEVLSKVDTISCRIAKNHSIFLTNKGKLIVLGQDIECDFKMKNYADCDHKTIESHFIDEFQAPVGSKLPFFRSISNRNRSVCADKRNGLKRSDESSQTKKIQQHRLESYIKESRSDKVMSFENVINIGCTRKFSLALTGDNRIYFWGTRSYNRFDVSDMRPKSIGQLDKRTLEAQLVPRHVDDCFVKIGPTNSSLMKSIQHLGSDQPIIHAQDPQLIANSLSDLWILDYQLASLPSSPSISSDDSQSPSDTRFYESSATNPSDNDGSNSSCCSECCSQESRGSSGSESFKAALANHISLLQPDELIYKLKRATQNRRRHDAILEPQPIVSLYVPAMFNHQGNYLRLVSMFCFDEDRFYLILETTVKPVPKTNSISNGQPISQSRTSFSPKNKRNSSQILEHKRNASEHHPSRSINIFGTTQRFRNGLPITNSRLMRSRRSGSLPIGLVKSYEPVKEGKNDQTVGKSAKVARSADQAREPVKVEQNEREDVSKIDVNSRVEEVAENQSSDLGSAETKEKSPDAINEGSYETENLGISIGGIRNRNISGEQLENLNVVSSFGMSLEEPRSLSTFVANSMGPHLVVNLGSKNELAPSDLLDDRSAKKRAFLGRSKRSNKSDSTGGEDTSSMPSWVRNEFIEFKQEQQNHLNEDERCENFDDSNRRASEDQWIFQIDSNNEDRSRTSIASYHSTFTTVTEARESMLSIRKVDSISTQPGGNQQDQAGNVARLSLANHDFENTNSIDWQDPFRIRTKSAGESNLKTARLRQLIGMEKEGVKQCTSTTALSNDNINSSETVLRTKETLSNLRTANKGMNSFESNKYSQVTRSHAQLSSTNESMRQQINMSPWDHASMTHDRADEILNGQNRTRQSSASGSMNRLALIRSDHVGSNLSLTSLKKSLTRLFC